MWFGEVLEDHDKAMGYEHDDPFKADDTKMWSFKVKSGVKDTSLSVGQDVVSDDKGGYNCKHKTELKTKLSAEWDAKLVSSNKEHEADLEYKPADLNKNGQQVEVELEAKCQPIKNTFQLEKKVKLGGFDMGPIKPWVTAKFSTDDAMNHKLENSLNLVYEKDYHLAYNLSLDKDMALKSVYGYLAMVNSTGVGTWFTHAGQKHSMELQYDVKNNSKGMFGQPLFLRYGGKFKFGSVNYTGQALWGERLTWKDKSEWQVNKNLKVALTCVFDVQDACLNAELAKLKTGVSAELKL